jgi:cytochrome c peroxidase
MATARSPLGATFGVVLGVAVALLTACNQGDDAPPDPASEATLSAEAELGRRIFSDPSLSASGGMSCATCHDPAFAHAQGNALPAQLGGADLSLQGRRVSPSIRYLAFAPPFALDSAGTPGGGLFWDGRASTLADQAGRPFLNPVEMALASKADLVARIALAPYAVEFRALFGADILGRPDAAFERVQRALAAFQREDPALRPFSSKFDAVLQGRATLTAQEQRGFDLFRDPARGNCAFCHPAGVEPDGRPPLFTNFSYHALGVPRNPALAANADPAHFDLGLCGREGGDLAARPDLCGAFKVPSLRNVDLRQALFHNGRFTELRDAVAFYAERDLRPEKLYPRGADGQIERFDDLPVALRGAVVTRVAPYDRRPGDAPALSDEDVDAIVAFLRTLTDGWTP